mgnify:CR=1 FL=1
MGKPDVVHADVDVKTPDVMGDEIAGRNKEAHDYEVAFLAETLCSAQELTADLALSYSGAA